MSTEQLADFRKTVWQHYRLNGRHQLPWRVPDADGYFDPYKVLVSELMLQQTQVNRVLPKYQLFLELFPTVETLASTSLAAVLTAWSGLGYNRRAKFLHQAAKTIMQDFAGVLPDNETELVKLPGVGKNTAGAILVYAFNQPVVFVETNIRTVYFYHFFASREVVNDGEVAELVGETLDRGNPRGWYWALMDYGSHLKSAGMKLNTLSKHYVKQSKFEGSKRQIRGQVIRVLAIQDRTLVELSSLLADPRLESVLTDLMSDGLITKSGQKYHLSR
ncbi:MAG: A/G-specific adenine glycosylase [Candidatus Saccharimonadales bacterium]